MCVYVYMSLRTIVLKEPRTALDLASLDFPSKIQEPLVPGKCCTSESKASSSYFGIRISIFLRTPYEPLLVKNPHIPPSKARATSAARIASWITTPTATAAGSNRGESLLHWWMVRRLPCQQKTLQLKIDGLAVLK